MSAVEKTTTATRTGIPAGLADDHPHIQLYYVVHAGPSSANARVIIPGNGSTPVLGGGGGGPPHINFTFEAGGKQYVAEVNIKEAGS